VGAAGRWHRLLLLLLLLLLRAGRGTSSQRGMRGTMGGEPDAFWLLHQLARSPAG
jgi:hypothetical protein